MATLSDEVMVGEVIDESDFYLMLERLEEWLKVEEGDLGDFVEDLEVLREEYVVDWDEKVVKILGELMKEIRKVVEAYFELRKKVGRWKREVRGVID